MTSEQAEVFYALSTLGWQLGNTNRDCEVRVYSRQFKQTGLISRDGKFKIEEEI